ncbi:hypothetical protein HK101_009588 [Irineochytrium annulatum]|nr:hypothetical protein HK101_009588 [Irineochytrium annulatum]
MYVEKPDSPIDRVRGDSPPRLLPPPGPGRSAFPSAVTVSRSQHNMRLRTAHAKVDTGSHRASTNHGNAGRVSENDQRARWPVAAGMDAAPQKAHVTDYRVTGTEALKQGSTRPKTRAKLPPRTAGRVKFGELPDQPSRQESRQATMRPTTYRGFPSLSTPNDVARGTPTHPTRSGKSRSSRNRHGRGSPRQTRPKTQQTPIISRPMTTSVPAVPDSDDLRTTTPLPHLHKRTRARPQTPPAENDYVTRPMSPHKPYILSHHVRAMALKARPQEVKDNFEQRMRGLFLPSLFQSTEDITGLAALRRKRQEEAERRRGPALSVDNTNGDDQDDGGRSRAMSARARTAQRRATRAMGLSKVEKDAANRVSRDILAQGGAPAAAPTPSSNPIISVVPANMSSKREKNSSARIRQFLSKPTQSRTIQYPMATIDRARYEMSPPDLDLCALRWRVLLHWALRERRRKVEVLEDRSEIASMAAEQERAGGVVRNELTQEDLRRNELRKDRMDIISAMRVERVIAIPRSQRDEKDLDVIDKHRYKLYNTCKIESHPRGTVLIKEGHVARYIYIILLGECLLQIRPMHLTSSVTLKLKVGGCAGEFSSYGLNEVRDMRATCLMRTEVLRVDKLDFVTISREARNMDSYIAEYFVTVPPLLSADKAVPIQLSQRSVVRRYETDTLIVRAGEVCPNVYFVVRGKVRALHLVTFLKIDQGPLPGKATSKHRYSLIPYNGQAPPEPAPPTIISSSGFASRPTRFGESEVVRELAGVVDIVPGQIFPPLGPSRIELEGNLISAARRQSSVGGSNGDLPLPGASNRGSSIAVQQDESSAYPAPFHFVVTEKLECVVIARQDLAELLPPEVYRRLHESSIGITNVSGEEIEERYLASQGWRGAMELDKKVMKDLTDVGFKDASWSQPVVPYGEEYYQTLD